MATYYRFVLVQCVFLHQSHFPKMNTVVVVSNITTMQGELKFRG